MTDERSDARPPILIAVRNDHLVAMRSAFGTLAVHVCETAAEALKAIRSQGQSAFAAVVVDFMVPVNDRKGTECGLGLMRLLATEFPAVPRVLAVGQRHKDAEPLLQGYGITEVAERRAITTAFLTGLVPPPVADLLPLFNARAGGPGLEQSIVAPVAS